LILLREDAPLDATTRQLCDMLESGNPELRAAAARVVAELQPAEPPLLAALGSVVKSGVGTAPLYALRALAASPEPEAIPHLIPALAGPADLRQEAADAIARFGRGALPHLKSALLGAELPLRKGAATVLARIGGKAAHELLLRGLAEGHLDLSKHICFELDQAIQSMSEDDRSALADLVCGYLAEKRTLASEAAAASGLILLGFLKSPRTRAVLLGFARPRRPPEVRRRALLALRGIAGSLTPADLTALSSYLADDDLPSVALPAIELLRPLDIPAAAAGKLVPLVGSPHQAVRDFAIAELGKLDTPEAAKTLVEQMDAAEPGLRELALSALQRNPAAVPMLLKRVRTEKDPHRFWTLVRVLEHHAGAIPPSQGTALVRLLTQHFAAGDPRAEPLSYLVRRAAPKQLDAALLKRAVALKGDGCFAEAHRMLTIMVRGGAASPDALYEAAVVALKVSPRSISRHERHADPCLERLDLLLGHPEVKLASRLCAEECLGPDELFYVGFHFAEQLTDRREFGCALLRHLVAAAPRSAVASHARNKLRLEAFPPETWAPQARPRHQG